MRTHNQLAQALINAGFVKVADTKIKTQLQPVIESDKPEWSQLSEKERAEYRVIFTA
jgi:hypothetical protein